MEVAHEFRLGYHRRAEPSPSPRLTTDSEDEEVEDDNAPEPVIPKGLKWGRNEWLLTAADDHVMRIFDRSFSLKTTTDAGPDRFFVSCKGRPIHLVGRVDEQDVPGSFGDCSRRDDTQVEELGIIATYPGFNHVEEVTHAFSLCASSAHVFGGYESAVRVFDLARPGHRSVLEIVTNTRKRNYGRESPHGILGALSLREESGVLAAGSYSGQIGLYDPFRTAAAFFCQKEESCGGGFGRRNDSQHGLAGKGARAGKEKKRQKATCKYALGVCSNVQPGFDEVVDGCSSASPAASRMGGITQLEWVDSFHLLSGHRKDDYLRLWDIRMLGPDQQACVGGAKGPLVFSLPRSSRRTAQRLSFCVSGPCCLSGDDAGFVHWYRLDTGERARSERLGGCEDVVVSCDWSPDSPLIATCQVETQHTHTMERGGLQDLKRAAAVPHRRKRDSDANRFFVQLCQRVDHESAVSRRSERVAALSDFLAWVHARQEQGNQASVVTAVSVGRAELFLLRVLAWFLVEAQNVVVFTPRGDAASQGGVGRGQRQRQAKSTRLLSMQASAILAFLQHPEDRHFFVPSIIGSGAVTVFAHVLTPDWQPGVPEEDDVRRAVLNVFGRLVEPGATADDNGYKALLCESVQLVRVTCECLRELVSDSACEAAGALLLSLFQGHDEKREREVLRGLAELLGGGAKSASTSVLLQRHAVRIFHRLLADIEEFPPPHSSARDADIVAPILKRVAEIAFSIPASGAASVLDFSEASKQKVAGEQAAVIVADAKEQDDDAQLSLVDKQFSFCASGTSPEDDMSASTVLAPMETSFGLVGSCTPRLPTLLTTPSTRSLSERAVAMHRDICGGGDEGENPSLAAASALDPDAGTALSKTRAALSSARIPRSSHPYFFACPPVVREGAASEALESLDVLVAPPARGASLAKPASAPMEQLEAGSTAALSSDVSLATDALQCLKSSVAALDGDVLGLRAKLLAHLTADLPAHLAQLEIDASRQTGCGSAVGVDVVGRCVRILRGQTSSTASADAAADAAAEVGASCPLIRLMAEHQQQQPVSWSPLQVPLPAALLAEVLRHDGADFFAAELRPSNDYGLFEARFGQFYSLVLMWDLLLHLLARDLDVLRARKVPACDLSAFATHLLCYCLDVGRAPLFLQQSAFWYLKQLLCIAERVAVASLRPRKLLHAKLEAMIRNSSDVCDLLAPTAWGKNAASDAGTYRFGCKRRPAHENMDDLKHLKLHLAQLRFWLRNKDLVRLGRELEVQQIALARDVDEVTRNSQEEVLVSTDLLSLVDVTPPLQLQLSEEFSLRAAIPDFRIPRPLSGVRWLCERELLLRAALEVRNTVAIPWEFDDVDLDGASARQLIPIATTNVQRIVPDYVDVFFPRDDVSESSIATRSSMFPRFGFELESQLSAEEPAAAEEQHRGCDDVADRREEDVTSGEKKDCNPLPPVKMCWTSSRLHGRKVGVNNERNSVAPGVTTAVLSSCTNSALGARSARQRGMTTRPDSGVVVQSGAAYQAPVCGANALVVGFGTASAVPALRPRRKKLVHDYNYSRNYSDYPAARVGESKRASGTGRIEVVDSGKDHRCPSFKTNANTGGEDKFGGGWNSFWRFCSSYTARKATAGT
eukprot:g10878.t1